MTMMPLTSLLQSICSFPAPTWSYRERVFLPLHCTVFLLRRCTFVTDVHHAEVHRLFFLRQWVIGLYIMLDLDIDGCTNARERA